MREGSPLLLVPYVAFLFRVSVSGLCLLLQQTHCDYGTVNRGITQIGSGEDMEIGWKQRQRVEDSEAPQARQGGAALGG